MNVLCGIWLIAALFCVVVAIYGIAVAVMAAPHQWLEVLIWIVVSGSALFLIRLLIRSLYRHLR